MHDPALSDEADPLYRPLGDLGPWDEVAPDRDVWDRAVRRLDDLRRSAPQWSDMVGRGARLAAAHESGVIDGVHGADADRAMALLSGVASMAEMDADVRAHVKANDAALGLAAGAAISQDRIRLVHDVACRPQQTHRVWVDDRVQDHVFAHGEYKHHPNHVPVGDGAWRAHAPVAQVSMEMHLLKKTLGSPAFAGLHPVVQAAYALYALTHVGPFADGNGRVARVLASAFLLRHAGIPLLVPAGDAAAYGRAVHVAGAGDVAVPVDFVLGRVVHLVTLVAELHATPTAAQSAALDRWCRQVGAAEALGGLLLHAAEQALERHRVRTDLGWPPLADAEVLPPPAQGRPVILRVALPGEVAAVEEVLRIDPHPLEGEGAVVLRAEEARLRLEVAPGEPVSSVSARLDPWLDRVTSTLALRVAAELE